MANYHFLNKSGNFFCGLNLFPGLFLFHLSYFKLYSRLLLFKKFKKVCVSLSLSVAMLSLTITLRLFHDIKFVFFKTTSSLLCLLIPCEKISAAS